MAKRKIREWCHWCESYQEFEYDPDDLGEQVIICPNCGHDHYRRADDGQLLRTGRQSLAQSIYISYISGGTTTNTTIGPTGYLSSWTFNSTTGYFYPTY